MKRYTITLLILCVLISTASAQGKAGPELSIVTPNDGEQWSIGDEHTILWRTLPDTAEKVKIELSTDSGTTWTILMDSTTNDGNESWTPFKHQLSATCLLRISSIEESSITTQSKAVFSIVANATEIKGDINFDSKVDSVDVRMISDISGDAFEPTATELWIADVNSDDKVTSSDVQKVENWILNGDWNPTINISAPEAAATWHTGQGQMIEWTSDLISPTSELLVELSTDRGQTWTAIFDSTKNDGSEIWQPALEHISNQCHIRVSTAVGGVFAVSERFKTLSSKKPTIRPLSSDSTYSPGDKVCIEIHVGSEESPVKYLYDIEFQLTYPASYLKLDHTEIGEFMGSNPTVYSTDTSKDGIVEIEMNRKVDATVDQSYGCVYKCYFVIDENTQDGVTLDLEIDNVTASDQHDDEIQIDALMHQISIKDCIVTWPGDTNMDGVVDERDILPIGMYWGTLGPSSECRMNSQNDWIDCCCTPWNSRPATCVDTNGDGKINQEDVKKVATFWKKQYVTQMQSGTGETTATMDSIGGYVVHGCNAQDEFCEAVIYVHDVIELLGASFELTLEPADKVELLNVDKADFLGNEIVFFYHMDKATSTVSVGTTRKKNQGGISGTGHIAKIRFKRTSSTNETIHLTFKKQFGMNTSGAMAIMGITNAVQSKKSNGLPTDFTLHQNYPNPFNPSTHIDYELPSNEHVNIVVLNALGQKVFTLIDEEKNAGHHSITWSGINERGEQASSGVYIVAMKAGNFVQTRKMLLMR